MGGPAPAKLRSTRRLIFITYNVVYWIPVIAFTPIMDYRTGFITFFGIVVFRAAANLYRNNVLTLEQAERFPLRIP